MKKLVACGLVLAVTLFSILPSATAIPPFRKSFLDKYVVDNDNAEFVAQAKKVGCNLCHVPGEDKAARNPYGEELAKLITGDVKERLDGARANGAPAQKAENEKILAELDKAFAEVEKLAAPSGGTFGERIKGGQIPVDAPASEE